MALNAELARLGVTGAVRVAALGTTAPTDLTAWGAGWHDLGYISDDGVTESAEEDSETFTPWQASTPIRTEITSSTKTFSFTCWESNAQTVSLYYRVPVEEMVDNGSGLITFDEKGKPKRDLRAFGIDVIDGSYQRRFILPYAEVTERGEITYVSNELIGYELTITAYPGQDEVAVRRMFQEGWTLPVAEPAA